jgi:sporulation and spore germination protein/immunoglobulin-like protein involved in spore germination
MTPLRHRTPPLGILTSVLVALVVAACGASAGALGPVPTAAPASGANGIEPSGEATPGASAPVPGASRAPSTGTETTTVRAYFFLGSFVDNAGLVPVLREIPRTDEVGAAAMEALLSGPNVAELGARPAMYTEVPDGTQFLGLQIEAGVATVNLSKEFETAGGSSSVLRRLAQVTYTLTQFPTVQSVRFQLDGEAVDALTDSGVTVEPVRRESYTSTLPVIFVDRPAWGGVLGNPGRIAGLANAFEATFQARIADGAGRGIVQAPVTAECGTGCWGAFDATIPYNVAAEGWGSLQVFELSAQDGAIVSQTEYPVWLTP